LFYAFHRALSLLREEGLEARIARHAKVAARLRAGLLDLGFKAIGPTALLSNTVACFAPPPGVDPARLVKRLKDEHNIYISGGLGPLRGKTIRIGTMGTQSDPEIMDWLLKAIRSSL
jgi:aspartate aminotransferase-like enzyme